MENNNMTDREMLELAAIGAGYNFSWSDKYDCAEIWLDGDRKKTFWQPHIDDGDAMRLRGKIGAWIADEGDAVRVEIHRYPQSSVVVEVYERDLSGGFASDQSVCRATRMAIIRASAEIGNSIIALDRIEQAHNSN